MNNKFFLFSFFIVVCAFDFYGVENNLGEDFMIEDGGKKIRENKEKEIKIKKKDEFEIKSKFVDLSQVDAEQNYSSVKETIQEAIKKHRFPKRLRIYPFAEKFMSGKDFFCNWEEDFEKNCGDLLQKGKTFLKFYLCNKIIKINKSSQGPFLGDNEDILKEDINHFKKKISVAGRIKIEDLLPIKGGILEDVDSCMKDYITGVIGILNEDYNEEILKNKGLGPNRYQEIFRSYVFKTDFNYLYYKEFFPGGVGESFIFSIIKYRTLLFRFVPTFIYNIFDLGRFLQGFYKYSSDGRYSLSFYKIPLILGKTSPIFFNIFQVDFFFNFPLGVVLSCLDFCAYSILRGNLSEKEKNSHNSFQKFFLVWRPDVDISFILEKSIAIEKKSENEKFLKKKNFEKEECHNAFAPVILKVLTNFVGVNFNIKISGKYFFSINLMSFVDDFILREYFLDSFNCFNKDLRPSSWSIFYELDNKAVNKL